MDNHKYDLEDRTIKFSENVILLCKSINESTITKPIISQLIRSATSIGANYCEANNASSKKDFRNKIFICKKESQETKYWIRLLKNAAQDKNSLEKMRELYKECQEYSMIFQKIITTINQKTNNK